MDNLIVFALVILMIPFIILFIILVVGTVVQNAVIEKIKQDIEKIGYDDFYDVQFFCRTVGASLEDFINSKSLRKQYEVYSDGGTTDFIKAAVSKKKSDESRNAGLAAGIVGVTAGLK